MITSSNLRRGMVIELDKNLFEVQDVSRVKPGKGGAFTRTKIKNLNTGAITERMFRSEEKLTRASISTISIEYLYRLDIFYHFMDFNTNDEYILTKEQLGNKMNFLMENQTVTAKIYQGKVIDIELPASVVLTISHTEPGLKGNTVSGATKEAILETRYKLQVPLFIKTGDRIKVDTRNGKYIGRV